MTSNPSAGGRPLLGPLLRLIWRYLRNPRGPATDAIVQTYCVENILDMPVLYSDRHGLRYLLYPDQNPGAYLRSGGNYEIVEPEYCLSYLKPGMTVLDVGTNIGLYSLLFSKAVGPSGSVHSFEPESTNFTRLGENLRLNQSVNVTANNMGVFSTVGEMKLNVYPVRFGAWHTFGSPSLPNPDDGEAVRPERVDVVPVTTLDHYCEEKDIATVDLLKIDVEGAELDVLKGADGLLTSRSIKRILFEVSAPQSAGSGQPTTAVFEYLRLHGYRCYSLDENGLAEETYDSLTHYSNYVGLIP